MAHCFVILDGPIGVLNGSNVELVDPFVFLAAGFVVREALYLVLEACLWPLRMSEHDLPDLQDYFPNMRLIRRMFTLTSTYRYYFYAGSTDMLKDFDGLCGLIHLELGRSCLSL